MKKHKVTFTAELDEKNNQYITHLEQELDGKFTSEELIDHMVEIIAAFTETMSKAYTEASGETNQNLN